MRSSELKLVLGAKREAWRPSVVGAPGASSSAGKDPRAAEAEFQKIRPKVLERDRYTCRYCGFRAEKFMEVHHLDDDHEHNAMDNLITACPLCHQVFHMGLAGKQQGGILILLPELSQADLNRLVHAIWLWSTHPDRYDAADMLYERLKMRAHDMEYGFGDGASNPALVGDILHRELSDKQYEKREALFRDVRLLALPERFTRQIEAWKGTVYKTYPPQGWPLIAERLLPAGFLN